jgi:hypothetical protein
VLLTIAREVQEYTSPAQRTEKKKLHRRIKAVVSKYLNKIPLPPAVAVPIQRSAFSVVFSVASTGIIMAVRIQTHGRNTMKCAGVLFNTW